MMNISRIILKPTSTLKVFQAASLTPSSYLSTIKKIDYEDITDEMILENMDFSLTPEQKAYAQKLKNEIRGGPNSKRSLYRHVPLPHEITPTGNFVPKMSRTPETLIEYALSFVPPREGPRRNNDKRRSERKLQTIREEHKKKKLQNQAAYARKLEKKRKMKEYIKQILEEAEAEAKIREEYKKLRAVAQATKSN